MGDLYTAIQPYTVALSPGKDAPGRACQNQLSPLYPILSIISHTFPFSTHFLWFLPYISLFLFWNNFRSGGACDPAHKFIQVVGGVASTRKRTCWWTIAAASSSRVRFGGSLNLLTSYVMEELDQELEFGMQEKGAALQEWQDVLTTVAARLVDEKQESQEQNVRLKNRLAQLEKREAEIGRRERQVGLVLDVLR